jgi:hypothetical protein
VAKVSIARQPPDKKRVKAPNMRSWTRIFSVVASLFTVGDSVFTDKVALSARELGDRSWELEARSLELGVGSWMPGLFTAAT